MQDPAVKQLIDILLKDQQTRYSGGIERLLLNLSTVEGQQSYREWKALPVTALFLDALKSLAETGAGGIPADNMGLALAHGSTSGLNLAVRLMEDPTRVFPSIFDSDLRGRAVVPPSVHIEETYNQSPEDL